MAQSYTPGLRVSRCVRHRTKRTLPILGEVLVAKGDRVTPQQAVARTYLPGDILPINLANAIGVSASDVPGCMLKKVGEEVYRNELLAHSPGIFGFFKKEFHSPASGKIETISNVTGQILLRGDEIPVEVKAFLGGEVVRVIPEQGVEIEADVAMVQGIFGICGEAYGTIVMACENPTDELRPDHITGEMQGKIVIGGARMTGDAIQRAIEVGTSAVISGGMDDQDLKEILGYDLGVAITGSETIGTTLIITEGFGEIAMARRTFELLRHFAGREASVNGATQIRAGVMRPEILIPLNPDEILEHDDVSTHHGSLESGAEVRIIRDPYFGILGTVAELPSELTLLESGSKARVLTVTADDGRTLTVPRANVELIEE
jgi:transcription antitermination factor NusG